MKFNLDVGEIFKAFDDLDSKTALSALSKASNYIMKPTLNDIRAKVKEHKDTGLTLRTIGIKTKQNPKNAKDSVVWVRVGMVRKTAVIRKKKYQLNGVGVRAIAQEYGNVNFEEDSFVREIFGSHKLRMIADIESAVIGMIVSVKIRKSLK